MMILQDYWPVTGENYIPRNNYPVELYGHIYHTWTIIITVVIASPQLLVLFPFHMAFLMIYTWGVILTTN